MDIVAAKDQPPCSTCGADLDRSDPQGNICTGCNKYESSCTCEPVADPNTTTTCGGCGNTMQVTANACPGSWTCTHCG
jgi:hypothetical protein